MKPARYRRDLIFEWPPKKKKKRKILLMLPLLSYDDMLLLKMVRYPRGQFKGLLNVYLFFCQNCFVCFISLFKTTFGLKTTEFPWRPPSTKWNICSQLAQMVRPSLTGDDMFTVALCVIVTPLTPGFPHPFLIGHWFSPRINMQGAWLSSCNLIWNGAEMIRCLTWSHLYLAGGRDWIFPLALQELPEVRFWQTRISL